jgi:hypothetical protein
VASNLLTNNHIQKAGKYIGMEIKATKAISWIHAEMLFSLWVGNNRISQP